ncbi:hydrogenase expression/formation protein HypE [Lachnospiraceae bacterium NE2001]|nr:hydrogenase expression/formation protein HypE [Lachnospiraceae bacterium NE2001]
MEEKITLAHGSGGVQTNKLINNIFKKHFDNPYLTADDAAVLDLSPAENDAQTETESQTETGAQTETGSPAGSSLKLTNKVSMSTDGFIVSPYEFPGGNIGKLSICGTVNDIACMGAKPEYLTCAMVIEEGFPVAKLDEIAAAMAKTASEAGVYLVAGDTKVAGRGQVDKIFITTTGFGHIFEGVATSGAFAKPGDKIIVTGDIGRHGCTILLERNDFKIDADITSDCAPLNKNIEAMLNVTKDVHVIRDATRGGVGTVLYEIAGESNVGILLDYESIPVADGVKGVCGMLGLEPLYLACEGRLVIFAPASEADKIVEALKAQPNSEGACIIGEVTEENPGKVVVETAVGAKTMLSRPSGELLPRIC